MDQTPEPTRKKKKSPVFFFPPHILKVVNDAIDEGWRSPYLHHLLTDKYSAEIKKIPCRVTLDRYIKWYEGQKNEEAAETTNDLQASASEIQKGLEKILDPGLHILDKKSVLETLVRKCGDRIKTLERWQRTTISPQFEGCLVRYFAEVRALIETLAKLNNEFQPDKSVIVNIVDSQIQPMFQAFYTVIKAIAPDKIEIARKLLKEELRRNIPSPTQIVTPKIMIGGNENGQNGSPENAA